MLSNYNTYELESKWKWIKKIHRNIKICKWDVNSLGEVAVRFAAFNKKVIGNDSDQYVFVTYCESGEVCNLELLKMIGEHLCVVNSSNYELWSYVFLNHYEELDFSEYEILNDRRYKNIYCDNDDVFLEFTKEKQKMGKKMLRALGITGEYVCFFSRDTTYNEKLRGKEFGEFILRDGNFENYEDSILYLKSKGIQSVRMGKYQSRIKESEEWINFAVRYDDFLDLFLLANCKFFVGDVSGIGEIPKLFGKPVLYINATSYIVGGGGELCVPNNLIIRKKLYHARLRHYLSLTAIINYEKKYSFDGSRFLQNGIIAEENTPKEIYDAVNEMYERVSGTWKDNEEDEKFQKKYLAMTKKYEINMECFMGGSYVCRMGSKFLRENLYLIE